VHKRSKKQFSTTQKQHS